MELVFGWLFVMPTKKLKLLVRYSSRVSKKQYILSIHDIDFENSERFTFCILLNYVPNYVTTRTLLALVSWVRGRIQSLHVETFFATRREKKLSNVGETVFDTRKSMTNHPSHIIVSVRSWTVSIEARESPYFCEGRWMIHSPEGVCWVAISQTSTVVDHIHRPRKSFATGAKSTI